MSNKINKKQEQIANKMIKKNSEKIIKKSQNNEKKLNLIIQDLLEQNKALKNDNSKITKKYRALK